MKAADIKTGVVYAEKASEHYSANPVVFLAPLDRDHIYARWASRAARDGLAFEKASDRITKIGKSGPSWKTTYFGYPAVQLYGPNPEGMTYQDRVAALTEVTFEDFLAATSATDPERGIQFVVVIQTRTIVSTWAEEQAKVQAKAQADEAAKQWQRDQVQARIDRSRVLVERARALGLTVDWSEHSGKLFLTEELFAQMLTKLEDAQIGLL